MFGIKTRIVKTNSFVKWKFENYKAYQDRTNRINKYIKSHKVKKLNLGCWPYLMEGWLNTDLYGNKDLTPLDMTQRFPINDSTFDYVFSEHTIEHFTLKEGLNILKECYRILKPGGKIRLATPDLKFLIDLYGSKKSELQKEYVNWATDEFLRSSNFKGDVYVINNFVRSWGHQFIYDYKSLKNSLLTSGFIKIKKYKPGISKDKELKDLEMHWKSIGRKDFNDLETFAIEGTKPDK